MEKYVFDLQSSDKIIINDDVVIIDCFVSVSDDVIGVDGYFEESGDSFFRLFDYNDSVKLAQ
jgi:hypothetical protein